MKQLAARVSEIASCVNGIPTWVHDLFLSNSESYVEWVDIFHRLIEAGYYLVATEITPDTANPILGGLLHYGSSGRFMLGIAASVAYLLAITATGRYGMPHCRLIHHGIEGGKAGRVGLIARSSSQFHRLAQLLLGPAEHAHGASGALVLTGGEAILRKDLAWTKTSLRKSLTTNAFRRVLPACP